MSTTWTPEITPQHVTVETVLKDTIANIPPRKTPLRLTLGPTVIYARVGEQLNTPSAHDILRVDLVGVTNDSKDTYLQGFVLWFANEWGIEVLTEDELAEAFV